MSTTLTAANKVAKQGGSARTEPELKKEGLVGGGVYLDFRNNDARLVIENIKRANQDGALIASTMSKQKVSSLTILERLQALLRVTS